MAYWHEPAKHKGGWTFPNRQGRVAVIFEGEDVRQAPFQGHFLRWNGTGNAPQMCWRRDPANWYELWPHEPFLASSMEEAKAAFQPLLPGIEDGSLDAQFSHRPYQTPVRSELIKEIEHANFQAKACIVRHPDGRHEVRYLVYAPDGKYFPATTPSIGERGWEWGVARKRTATLADDLASAEEIAAVELAEIIASDPEIKPRDAERPAF